MINRIIEFSANNRLLVIFLALGFAAAGFWSMYNVPLDAIPDLSDTQVIIYSRWNQSPDIIEDQVTYPIVAALLGAPRVRAVRGQTDFGYSFVYVIFEDGTDIYWARSRTLEYLSSVLPKLPDGVETEIGPDATGLGWIYQYVLVDDTGKHSLAEMRTLQDWYLRYYLVAVPGVAEVAPVGGYVQQFQVQLDPNRLQAFGIPLGRVIDAVRTGNEDVGGRLIEFGGTEYMVRGLGYARTVHEIESIVLDATDSGTPIRIKDIGQVTIGPDIRRGLTDLDGTGEAVSGIIVMRQGENALDVIDRVKQKIREIEPGLPEGVRIETIYDRSELIRSAIDNTTETLIEIMLTVAIIILLFLWHVPSALIPLITLPTALLISFIPFRSLGITANIMSLGGLAIAIGELADAAIVVVEQTHKKLEQWELSGRPGHYREVVLSAVKEVGGPSFFALLVIAVSFLPILTLEAQEGRLFKPLAYTKNLSMIVAAVLAITLDPALRMVFTHLKNFDFKPLWLCRITNSVLVGKIHSEEKHPISQALIRIYDPAVSWTLNHKKFVIGIAIALIVVTIPVFNQLGSEFMPPLDEEALFYMPSTMPGISIDEASRLLQVTDRIIKQFPETDRVLGKAGRAETSTDPAPLSMLETVITLKPKSQWRKINTWYSDWAPEWMKGIFRHITPDHISQKDLVNQLNEALKIPGVSNAWTMPIKARVDMLTTGMRTPVGIKISGADLDKIEEIGARVEALLPQVPGTRNVFAERVGGGYFLDFKLNRDEIARYGLSIKEVQTVVQNAIGGRNVAVTINGQERYPVNVRYMRDFRDDISSLSRVLVPAGNRERQIPLGQLATISASSGPSMIRNEDGLLTGYVFIDVGDRDIAGYVEEAQELLNVAVDLPPGYALLWSGQWEAMQRVKERLAIVVPLTLFLIVLLLYMNTRSFVKTMIVLLAVPFSAIGAVWFVYLLGYNMSVGVWVGLIALLGVDAETGVFMLLYLDLAYEHAKENGRLKSLNDLQMVIREGAAKRIRPKFMTVATTFVGLTPIMWSLGTGADVWKRIAAPVIGGILTSFLLELLVYPAIYEIWKWNFGMKKLSN